MLNIPLLTDVGAYIAAGGLSLTAGTNLFYGHLPDSPDLAVALFPSAGLGVDRDLPVEHPGLRIVVRGDTYANGYAKAYAIFKLLDKLSRQTLTATLYYYIEARGLPEQFGLDESGRPLFSVSFTVDKAVE